MSGNKKAVLIVVIAVLVASVVQYVSAPCPSPGCPPGKKKVGTFCVPC